MVDALEEVKRTGSALVLNCIQPQHVPNALDYYGADFLTEQRGDYDISACVPFKAGWWTYTVEISYRWDPQEQMWEYGQELLRVDDEDGEINLFRLAGLLLEDGFSLEE